MMNPNDFLFFLFYFPEMGNTSKHTGAGTNRCNVEERLNTLVVGGIKNQQEESAQASVMTCPIPLRSYNRGREAKVSGREKNSS